MLNIDTAALPATRYSLEGILRGLLSMEHLMELYSYPRLNEKSRSNIHIIIICNKLYL